MPPGHLTTSQASDYARQQGKALSVSYLVYAANSGRIKGEKIESGPVPYWLFSKTAIDEYLNSPRSRGRKPRQKAEATQPEQPTEGEWHYQPR